MRLTLWVSIIMLFAFGTVASRTLVPPTEQTAESWLQTSAVTTFGTNLSTQTIVPAVPTTGVLTVAIMPVFTNGGSGCTGGNPPSQVTVTMNWTGPDGTNQSYIFGLPNIGWPTLIASHQDVGSSGPALSNLSNQNAVALSSGKVNGWEASIVASSGTAVTYTTSSFLNSSGCTSLPQYTVFARASQ